MKTTLQTKSTSAKSNRQVVKTALYELQAALRNLYGQQSPVILVYGSYARGAEHPASDVDVLLIYPMSIQPGQEIRRISAVLADLNLRYQVLISVLPTRASDYRRAKGSFWQNLRRV